MTSFSRMNGIVGKDYKVLCIIYDCVVYYAYTYIRGNIIKHNLRTSMNERTHFFLKIYLLHFILEGVDVSVVCERWVETKTDCYHHHHHVVPTARISLTLSRHSSLTFIAFGWSSGLHPVSSHSCCMYVWAGRPAFARPYAGVHRSTSLMSSSLLLQQCPACLARLTCIVFVMGGRIVGVLWGVDARTCSVLLSTFLCNCCLVSSPTV